MSDTPTIEADVIDGFIDRWFALKAARANPANAAKWPALAEGMARVEARVLQDGRMDQIVRLYIANRDYKDELDKEHKERLAAIEAFATEAERRLRRDLNEQGVSSVRTDYGTAFKKQVTSATVGDRAALLEYAQAHDAWALCDIRAAKTAIKEFVDAKGEPPPGVNWRVEEVVQVRR